MPFNLSKPKIWKLNEKPKQFAAQWNQRRRRECKSNWVFAQMNDLRRILFLLNEVVSFRFECKPLQLSDLVGLYLHELEFYARSKDTLLPMLHGLCLLSVNCSFVSFSIDLQCAFNRVWLDLRCVLIYPTMLSYDLCSIFRGSLIELYLTPARSYLGLLTILSPSSFICHATFSHWS